MGNLKVLPYNMNTENTLFYYDTLAVRINNKYPYKAGMYYHSTAENKKCFVITTDSDCFNIPVEIFKSVFNELNHTFLTQAEVKSFEILWRFLTKKQRELFYNDKHQKDCLRIYRNTIKTMKKNK